MRLRSKHEHVRDGSEGDVRVVRTTGLASGGRVGIQEPGTCPVKLMPYGFYEGCEAWDLHILLVNTEVHAAVSLIRARDSARIPLFKRGKYSIFILR